MYSHLSPFWVELCFRGDNTTIDRMRNDWLNAERRPDGTLRADVARWCVGKWNEISIDRNYNGLVAYGNRYPIKLSYVQIVFKNDWLPYLLRNNWDTDLSKNKNECELTYNMCLDYITDIESIYNRVRIWL